ncbi:class I SAM-dependent methyltransferase [Alteraurantiacibacter palmitatis]|uniref:Methyltransferase domain-containing protein n=1 Tax=Alteraurantiacibacter palmitatis TaxID=2054628 RepID=A0ABV7E1D7_9SPHN
MTTPSVPQIFSRQRRFARRARHIALRRADPQAQFLRDHMAAEIVERLDFMRFTPALALVMDDAPDPLAALLAQRGSAIADMPLPDEELPYPRGGFDLIASMAQLDTVNDLPGALIHACAALAPGGLFIACLCGAGSLPALRKILLAADGERPAARIHPQIDNLAASGLMGRAGFSRQVVDSHSLTVRYRSLERMVADLRAQGLTNVLADAPPPLTRDSLARARAAFAAMADSEGRVTETFEILTLTGWR